MAEHLTGIFKIEGWDESAYSEEDDGRKLTQASVKQSFSGDIEGEGSVEWLMCYRSDQTAEFVGLQRIDGRLGGRSGSFVLLQTDGSFDSGTGELSGLRGQGQFSAPRASEATMTLDCDFD